MSDFTYLLPEEVFQLWEEIDAFKSHEMVVANLHLLKTVGGWLQADYAYWVGGVRLVAGEEASNDLLCGWRTRVVEPLNFPPTYSANFDDLLDNQNRSAKVSPATVAVTRGAGTFHKFGVNGRAGLMALWLE